MIGEKEKSQISLQVSSDIVDVHRISRSRAAIGRDQWIKSESFLWLNPLSEIQIRSAVHKTGRKGLNDMPCSLLPS